MHADDGFFDNWEASGYIRQYLSWNLDNPYVPDPDNNGERKGDYRYDLSMARTVGKLNLFKDFGNSQFSISGRVSEEYETNYLEDLQESMDGYAAGDLFSGRNKSSVNLMDDVYNEVELRELWWQTALTENTTLKVGKQQVVWGETDFFQSLDVVHGYDFRWRSFLEPENEELRKPLWMLNLVQRFDSVDGTLQALYIPGKMNAADQRGNSYDVEGGRWANNPNKGLSFASAPFGADVPYNYDHKDADMDDGSYGLRWKGMAGEWEYSLGWFHGPSGNPVINPNPDNPLGVGDSASGQPFLGAYKGEYNSDRSSTVGELIFPYIDTFGITANRYVESVDAVFSAEISYIPDSPYNVGIDAGEAGGCAFFPGFCGITEKDVVKSMLRVDKQLALQNYLGTSRPSFFSLQVFNTWITDYDRSDELVNTAGFSGRTKEYSTIVTAILAANYDNDRINPTLAVGSDLTYGGGFIIPSVEFAYGDNWRLRVEADLFFNDESQKRTLRDFNNTNLFGYFDGNDQLAVRLTYQF
ncbi:LysR family transcriptional regulator [Pseudomonas sp. PDM14]|nr:LysR family transcriptional regulator [Pseudomonas sp. PDM14]